MVQEPFEFAILIISISLHEYIKKGRILKSTKILLITMFASKDWLKETLVLIALITVVSTLVALFMPFPYSFPVTVGLVILIVWLIHRRSRYVPRSSTV